MQIRRIYASRTSYCNNLGSGLPVVGDMCESSALHVDGTPWAGAANRDGEATDRMRYRKCVTEYP